MSPEELIRQATYLECTCAASSDQKKLVIRGINELAAQIRLLREKLVEERMMSFEDWDGECFDTDIECPDKNNPAECHGCEIYERARQQLKAEMPEDWE